MRNELAYNLSGELGMPYMQSKNVVLIMNDTYYGTYQFCEQIRVDEARVNIFDWEKTAEDTAGVIAKEQGFSKEKTAALEEAMVQNFSWITSNRVVFEGISYVLPQKYQNLAYNGGYLLELDSYYDEVSKFTTDLGQPIIVFHAMRFVGWQNSRDSTVPNQRWARSRYHDRFAK